MSIEDIINYENEFDDNYVEENDEFLNFFDILNYFNSSNGYDIFEINPTYNVITSVKNYDYGLPGSGVLIWHIDEPEQNQYITGVNNDLMNKSISIEEGDGINHIGNLIIIYLPIFQREAKEIFGILQMIFINILIIKVMKIKII